MLLANPLGMRSPNLQGWDEATQVLLAAPHGMGSPRVSRRPRPRPAHQRLTDDMGGWKYSAPPSPSSPSPRPDAYDAAGHDSSGHDSSDDPAENGAGERAPGKNKPALTASVYE